MSTRRHITDLPLEIRQQIFGDYFKVQGGYTYDGKVDKLRNADNTPIDLSLIYTCRSIANDCKHLPLAVNTVHFSTYYREDWCSLAGCFNLAATYYRILQQDLVLHLAHLVTPEMHAQLEKRSPTFRSKLEAERTFHFRAWNTGGDVGSAEDMDATDTSQHVRPAVCQFVRDFYYDAVSSIEEESPAKYHGYYGIDGELRYYKYPKYNDRDLDDCDQVYQRWDWESREIDQCLVHCLRLIADRNPEEFAARVSVYLPHWDGKYPAEDFFNLRFEDWAIPSRSQVAQVLHLLGVPDFVWKLPDMWGYDYDFQADVGNNTSPGHFSEEYDHPTIDFEIRIRENIRFSAASIAIRFLGSLSHRQRTQLRTITIHEDLPAVNNSSLHGLGLVPFIQENPLLQVQRRVSVINCVMRIPHLDLVDIDHPFTEDGLWWRISHCELLPDLSCWLIDALAVANAGISPESFTLLLESGTDTDICTEAFQRLFHHRIAKIQAWQACMESGMLRTAVKWSLVKLFPEREMMRLTRKVAVGEAFQEAFMQLMDQTSTTLRCDFSPGLPENHQIILDEMRAHPLGLWHYWARHSWEETVLAPDHLKVRGMLAQCYEIQTREEYLESQARDHQ
ncbi:hypothetical protein ACHAQI_010501 [Fusarium lateritium]